MKKSELRVITETKRLIEYILTVTEKSPKKFKYSFVTKMHNTLFEIIELLYLANSIKLGEIKRTNLQKEAIVKFQLLDYICDISVKEKCLLFKQYQNIAEMINNCMKLLENWIISDQKRITGVRL